MHTNSIVISGMGWGLLWGVCPNGSFISDVIIKRLCELSVLSAQFCCKLKLL